MNGGKESQVSKEAPSGDRVAHPPDDYEEHELDPRVQEELEKLNQYTEEINSLEVQLEEANCLFRTLLTDSTHQLKSMAKKLGGCIDKSRPYFEALQSYHKAQAECQSAATHYQRASGIHQAAKETIALAEQRFLSNSTSLEFDNAWQEMLNHATIKVMEAEKKKTESEAEHLRKAALFQQAEAEVQRLEKKLGKYVQKSRPYFEQKDAFNKALAAQKNIVEELQMKVLKRKALYAQSLHNLEEISESIHARRRQLKEMRNTSDGTYETSQKIEESQTSRTQSSPVLARTSGTDVELHYDLDECDAASSISSSHKHHELRSMQSFDLEEIESSAASVTSSLAEMSTHSSSTGLVMRPHSESESGVGDDEEVSGARGGGCVTGENRSPAEMPGMLEKLKLSLRSFSGDKSVSQNENDEDKDDESQDNFNLDPVSSKDDESNATCSSSQSVIQIGKEEFV